MGTEYKCCYMCLFTYQKRWRWRTWRYSRFLCLYNRLSVMLTFGRFRLQVSAISTITCYWNCPSICYCSCGPSENICTATASTDNWEEVLQWTALALHMLSQTSRDLSNNFKFTSFIQMHFQELLQSPAWSTVLQQSFEILLNHSATP